MTAEERGVPVINVSRVLILHDGAGAAVELDPVRPPLHFYDFVLDGEVDLVVREVVVL